jgi:hypothetical protein
MSGDQLRLEYAALKQVHNRTQSAARSEGILKRMDFAGLMEKFSQRTELKHAIEFSNKVLLMSSYDEETRLLQTELSNDLKSNQDALNQIQTMRKVDQNFLRLLAGCIHPSISLQAHFQKFRLDWQRAKKRVDNLYFFDPVLAREVVYLECIFRIFHYYYKSMSEAVYEETKKIVLAWVGKWEAEDLISENPTAQLVFSNFMTRGKGSRFEKDITSLDDIATNHSSNQKIVKCTLMSTFIRKRNPRNHPFESESSLQECLPLKKLKEDRRQELDMSTLSQSNLMTLEPRNRILIPRSSALKRRSLNLPRSSTLTIAPVINVSLEEIMAEKLMSKSIEESRFDHNEMSGRSLYDKARSITRRRLAEIISEHCHPKLARCYAKKLEGELFSQFFGCLNQYSSESKKLSFSLRTTLAKDGMADNLMTTAFDYQQIIRVAEKLGFRESCTSNFSLNSNSPSLFSSAAEEKSILDVDPAEMLHPGRCQMLDSDVLTLEDESNSQLVREVSRVKELEILQLKELISKLESENELLKKTLSKVMSHLTNC